MLSPTTSCHGDELAKPNLRAGTKYTDFEKIIGNGY
jgi:hypothetical protein